MRMTMPTASQARHSANNTRSLCRRHPALERTGHRVLCLLAACLIAGCAATASHAPAADGSAPPGAVSVTYADAAGVAQAGNALREPDKVRRAWLDALALHLAERAGARLREGQRLEVKITDVQRAGGFEPELNAQGSDVRVVRVIYTPRIDLRFKLLGPGGAVLREGTRVLRDSGFLTRPRVRSSDPLHHEKALLDDWIDKEFAPQG